MEVNEFKEFNKKVRAKGLVMSRIPEKTRELFVNIANEEFCSDYGLCLKWCLDEVLEFQKMKIIFGENLNMKLDILGDKLDSVIDLVNKEEINEEKSLGIKMLGERKEQGGKR